MRALVQALERVDHDELVLRLTALVALVFGAQSEVLHALFTVIAGLGLVAPMLLRQRSFWGLLVGLSLIFHGLKWFEIDNHKVLFGYWLLALVLVLKTPDLGRSLATAGRLLVGTCFGCATFWKLFGGQYLDGSFFSFSFLTNSKFAPFAQAFSGLDAARVSHFDASIDLLRAGLVEGSHVVLPLTDRLHTIALGVSWWTILAEGAIALSFLLGDRLPHALRHLLLIAFIVAVYPIATVPGFACMLVVMGLADLRPERRRLRTTYLCVFAFSVLSFIPKSLDVYLRMLMDFFAW